MTKVSKQIDWFKERGFLLGRDKAREVYYIVDGGTGIRYDFGSIEQCQQFAENFDAHRKDIVIKEILATHGYAIEEAEGILNNVGRAIYQAGMRGVVKWINKFSLTTEIYPIYKVTTRRIPEMEWQAQLKKWGRLK